MKEQYIRIKMVDGLGMQLWRFYGILTKIQNSHFKLIVDPRNWDVFRWRWKTDPHYFSFEKFSKFFDFHERVIIDPVEIDKIDEKIIIDVKSELYKDMINNGVLVSTKLKINEDILLLKLKKYPKLDFDITKCVGVHARLGNGEELQIDQLKKRVRPMEMFIDKMKELKDKNFFVCSDSEKFINLCHKEFPNRIKLIDRYFPEDGAGPGHYPRNGQYVDHDPSELLRDALAEMCALAKCSSIICNRSYFNWYARSVIGEDGVTML